MSRLCIIPARGGSKRIPRKNIRDFLGKPIIAYSIEVALESGLFDEVMVSTDDEEIAEVSRCYGAKVPFIRSNKNSNDFAGTTEVLVEVLEKYEEEGSNFKYGCCLYATAPLVSAPSLNRSFEIFERDGYDTLFPVVAFSYPIQRAVKLRAGNKVQMFQPENLRMRSQNLEPAYHDAGQFYWFYPNKIMNGSNLWTDNAGAMILTEMEVQDIDCETDWKMAELKHRIINDALNH